jgi:hypothetical protein
MLCVEITNVMRRDNFCYGFNSDKVNVYKGCEMVRGGCKM